MKRFLHWQLLVTKDNLQKKLCAIYFLKMQIILWKNL